jgi:hypothetical protein
MTARRPWPILQRAVLGVASAAALAGCGLKGPLALPEKTERVIIRGPQDVAAAPAPTPAAEPPPAPAKPEADKQPPPPLPGGNPGTSRGG